MSKPYTDKIKGNTKIRIFESDIESDELVWHRDRADRVITILEGDGWMFQMDNDIPKLLEAGDILNVSKMEYHRLYKAGTTPLKIQIEEPMKKFKTFQEEMTTTGDAGIPQDTKNMGPKKSVHRSLAVTLKLWVNFVVLKNS